MSSQYSYAGASIFKSYMDKHIVGGKERKKRVKVEDHMRKQSCGSHMLSHQQTDTTVGLCVFYLICQINKMYGG